MEKYTLFADKLTGKLLFNQPLAIYTSLPLIQKLMYQIYIYSVYWILILARFPVLILLTLLWTIADFIPLIRTLTNATFPRFILLWVGYFKPISLLKGRKSAKPPKLEKNTLICGTLCSPFDILTLTLKFKPRYVMLPRNLNSRVLLAEPLMTLNRPPIAFLQALFLESLILRQPKSDKCDGKIFKSKVLCFPEGTSTNGTGVLNTYLPQNVFSARTIVCATT